MEQEGTFNGNPLSMAAAKAVLTEVLTPDAYVRLGELGERLTAGLRDAIARNDLPASVTSVGCRGSVHFREGSVRDFRDAADTDGRLQHLAWLHQLNGGVFVPAGDPWTFSIAHSDADIDLAIRNFEGFAGSLA
jgi:glutamate-1-semialdehyde 2,1-aminomutase